MGYAEAVDYNDPLSILLAAEGEAAEVDERQSMFEAGSHRAKSFEADRTTGDTMGMSPFELACQDSLH